MLSIRVCLEKWKWLILGQNVVQPNVSWCSQMEFLLVTKCTPRTLPKLLNKSDLWSNFSGVLGVHFVTNRNSIWLHWLTFGWTTFWPNISHFHFSRYTLMYKATGSLHPSRFHPRFLHPKFFIPVIFILDSHGRARPQRPKIWHVTFWRYLKGMGGFKSLLNRANSTMDEKISEEKVSDENDSDANFS